MKVTLLLIVLLTVLLVGCASPEPLQVVHIINCPTTCQILV